MTREQQNTIERLALAHEGRVAVREGYIDGVVEATLPRGTCFRIDEDGRSREAGLNFSVDWGAR